MNAIDLLLSILTSPSAILWDISMMAITIALLLLAYMEVEEKSGRRFYWAEWPIPGTEPRTEEEGIRKAA